jgi:hypothetical protein
MPRITNTDEVYYNDPAVSMSKGYGFIGKSLEGTMKLEKYYAIHPPIFMLLQAGIFRIFGLSAFTLRGTEIFFFIFYMLLIVFLFYRLKYIGIYDNFAFFWITLLFLTEPTTFSCSRSGRSDMLGLFFGIAAFVLILSKSGVSISKKRWIFSASMIGLSISTHLAMIHFWLAYIIAACFLFGRRNRSFCALLIILPFFIFFGIWMAVYRENSLGALIQLHQHTAYFKGYFSFFGLVRSLLSNSLREFNQKGGVAFVLIVFSWVAIIVRLRCNLKQRLLDIKLGNSWIFMMALFAVGNFLFMVLFTGSGSTRAIVVLPIALAGLGVAVTRLNIRAIFKYLLTGLLGFLVFVGLMGHIYYFFKMRADWQDRAPGRFLRFVASIPFDKKVATVSNLWYEFIKSGHNRVRIIDFCFEEDKIYWQKNSDLLNSFDIIILDQNHPLLNSRVLSKRLCEVVTIGGENFIVLRR